MTSNRSICPIEEAWNSAALRRPGFLYIPARIWWNLRHRGVRYTLRATLKPRIANVGKSLGFGKPLRMDTPACPGAVLDLQPGELIQVKSLEEILNTLDGAAKHRGLVFTPEMRGHCGRRYRVFKRLELMFDEQTREQRRIHNTVLLEGVLCGGEGIGCHRSCFLYWREAWLRRANE
jgi:hypothetical protein